MRNVCRWAILVLFSAAVAADEWSASFSPADAEAITRDAPFIPLYATLAEGVEQNSPAGRMGLRNGDRLVGLDGLQIYGTGEWDLVRFQRTLSPGTMQVTVWRAGAVLTLVTHEARAVQRMGIGMNTPEGLDVALDQLATPSCGWSSFPRRAGVALLRWQAAAPATAERVWISELARLYGLLADQQWAEAAQLEVKPPEPELARLAAFYHRLALRHEHGEQEPDPGCLGEPRPWYTVNYPYPRLILPELGTFTHPDPAFMDGLARLRSGGGFTAKQASAVIEEMDSQPGEIHFAYALRRAAIDGRHHGGWPFRHADLGKDGARQSMITTLREQIASAGDQAAWSRHCLIGPLLLEARYKPNQESLVPLLKRLNETRSSAPLISYLGFVNARLAIANWRITSLSAQLAHELAEHPFQLTARPSRLFDYARARSAGLELQLPEPYECRWTTHLNELHAALHLPAPLADVRRRLAAAAYKPGVETLTDAQRVALLEEATACFRYHCSFADAQMVSQVIGAGHGVGLRNDFFSELLYRCGGDELDDYVWVGVPLNDLDHLIAEPEHVAGMRKAIAAIPWKDPSAIAAAVEAARVAWGSSGATLVLAEACTAHDQPALAAALSERVVQLYQRIRTYGDIMQFNRQARELFDFKLVSLGVLGKATVPLAIVAGERFARDRNPDQEWDSVQLALAIAYLAADRKGDAAAALIRSFIVGQIDKEMIYWCAGEPVTEAIPARTWLLRQLLAANAIDAGQRNQLLAVLKPTLIDDAFASLLGLDRAKLPTDPQAVKNNANDF